MKLARKSLPFLIAIGLMAACLLAVGLAPLYLPNYKGTVQELEPPENANLLYINDTEELNLYPWNLYSGLEPQVEELEIEMYEIVASAVYFLGNDTKLIFEPRSQIKVQSSDQDGLLFFKDMRLPKEDGSQYVVNMALKGGELCYFSYMNEKEPEVSTDEMDRALKKLQTDWREFVEQNHYDYETEEMFPPAYEVNEGTKQNGEYLTNNNVFSSLMNRYQEFVDKHAEYLGNNSELIWSTIAKSEFTSLSYDNHIYLIFPCSDGISLVLIYSPTEERFVGFSLK